MVADPAVTPVTTPPALTDAIPAAPELHVPPVLVALSVMVVDRQTVEGPEMVPAVGVGLTVTVYVALAVPQLVVTV